MNKINISVELAQAIINYLARQPYGEVFQLIGELTNQAKVNPETKVEDKPEKK